MRIRLLNSEGKYWNGGRVDVSRNWISKTKEFKDEYTFYKSVVKQFLTIISERKKLNNILDYDYINTDDFKKDMYELLRYMENELKALIMEGINDEGKIFRGNFYDYIITVIL